MWNVLAVAVSLVKSSIGSAAVSTGWRMLSRWTGNSSGSIQTLVSRHIPGKVRQAAVWAVEAHREAQHSAETSYAEGESRDNSGSAVPNGSANVGMRKMARALGGASATFAVGLAASSAVLLSDPLGELFGEIRHGNSGEPSNQYLPLRHSDLRDNLGSSRGSRLFLRLMQLLKLFLRVMFVVFFIELVYIACSVYFPINTAVRVSRGNSDEKVEPSPNASVCAGLPMSDRRITYTPYSMESSCTNSSVYSDSITPYGGNRGICASYDRVSTTTYVCSYVRRRTGVGNDGLLTSRDSAFTRTQHEESFAFGQTIINTTRLRSSAARLRRHTLARGSAYDSNSRDLSRVFSPQFEEDNEESLEDNHLQPQRQSDYSAYRDRARNITLSSIVVVFIALFFILFVNYATIILTYSRTEDQNNMRESVNTRCRSRAGTISARLLSRLPIEGRPNTEGSEYVAEPVSRTNSGFRTVV